jgi:polyhydroxyalkanoate synthase subunit PhaC
MQATNNPFGNSSWESFGADNPFAANFAAFSATMGGMDQSVFLKPFADWLGSMGTQMPAFPMSQLQGAAQTDPATWLEWAQRYIAALQQTPGKDVSNDKRFANPAWQQHEFAHQMAAAYTVHATFLEEMVELLKLPPKQASQLKFSVEQWLAAMAPSNYLPFNPEALEAMQQSKGESLSRGLANLLSDLNKGRISQTDEAVYEIGKNVATTAGAVVYENPFIQLIQYKPLTEQVAKRPLLIVPPCINKFYILDLQPENSLVRHALEQGNTVFLVSWRNPLPDAADHEAFGNIDRATWDDYLTNGPLAALRVALDISGADKVNVLGFCVGGTLVAAALAALAAIDHYPAASVTLLTTLLDFTDPGILGVYIDEQQVALREATLAQGGLMPGRDLASSFSSLRPNDLIWNYVVNNYLKGRAPPAFDLLHWNSDSTNLPGPMFVQYLRRMYMDNALAKGQLHSLNVRLDLSAVKIPAYVFAAREDHIVPWKSAYASGRCLGSIRQPGNLRFVLGAAGHIAGVINPASKNKRSYWVGKSLPAQANAWFEAAQEEPGSWWRDWSRWLAQHGGGHTAAPRKPGAARYPPIEPAPGRYVRVRAV